MNENELDIYQKYKLYCHMPEHSNRSINGIKNNYYDDLFEYLKNNNVNKGEVLPSPFILT
jgi:hypothetical protein